MAERMFGSGVSCLAGSQGDGLSCCQLIVNDVPQPYLLELGPARPERSKREREITGNFKVQVIPRQIFWGGDV